MSGELRLSMLLTAQAEQAKQELGATTGKVIALSNAASSGGAKFGEFTASVERSGAASMAAQSAVSGLTRSTKSQAAEVTATARETARYNAELSELRARFNPIYAASRQYEQTLREIAEAERLGALSSAEAANARNRAAASMAPLTAGMAAYARGTAAGTMHTANLTAQFNDIGVMLAAGQNPLQLALQQGTQINQVFGQLGGHRNAIRAIGPAIMSMVNPLSLATLGVIAFGAAGVQWLMSLKGEAVDVQEQIDALTSSVDGYRAATRRVGPSGLEETERLYGRITAQVEQLTRAQERAAERSVGRELRTALTALVADLPQPDYVIDTFGEPVHDFRRATRQLRQEFAMAAPQADQFLRKLREIEGESSPEEMVAGLAELVSLLEQGADAQGQMTRAREATLGQILEMQAQAQQLVAIEENRGQWDAQRAQIMQHELELQAAINAYGEDARVVTELRVDAARRAFEEQLRAMDVSDDMKDALRQSWEAVNGIAAVDMAAGVAAAREEARGMADELARAINNAQSLAAQTERGLQEAQIRAQYSDPVDQAYHLTFARVRRAQAVMRDGADDREIAALDARANAIARNAAETARLNQQTRQLSSSRRAGTNATVRERQAVTDLITGLQAEIALLRETDPVQQEIIRQREVMAAATEAERGQIEELIRVRLREQNVLRDTQAEMEQIRDLGRSVLQSITQDLRSGASAGEILANIFDRLADKLLEMGVNGLSDILLGSRGSSGGGILSGILSAITGRTKHAKGDVIGEPTLFAYGNGKVGEMGEDGPEAIMPLTHAHGGGVGAIVDGMETTVPLIRLASGKLGVSLTEAYARPFAMGGTFGDIPPPPSVIANAAATPARARGLDGEAAQLVGRLEILPSPEFEARFRGQMQGIAMDIAGEALTRYDHALPARVEQISQDPAMRG